MTDKKDKTPTKTLDDAQIDTTTDQSRRRVLRGFGIGSLGLGAVGVAGCVPATVGTGFTDADNGPILDPAGGGRGPRRRFRTGITDADNGPIVDPVGFGRG